MSHRIVFFVTDGIQSLDLVGPLDAFFVANELAGRTAYEWQVASFEAGPVRAATGLTVQADISLAEAGAPDTLVFVGGAGPRTCCPEGAELQKLTELAGGAGRIATVCTGTFLMARLGIAGGRSVATHWAHTEELAAAFPDISVDPDALFVRDGNLWSSAGITAGIDMAMAMIAEDLGPAIAAGVARHLVVYLRRPGHQGQFSDPLAAQNFDAGRLSGVVSWIAANLAARLDNETLAEKAGMSQRHFTRLFRETMGVSPAQFVETLRLDTARTMLGEPGVRISMVASATGFASADSFRRAFERRFGIAPTVWRDRFTAAPA